MELILQVTAFCIVGAILAITLRKSVPEVAIVLILAAVASVLLILGKPLRELLQFFRELGERSGVSQNLLLPLYKTMGIALVVKIGGGLCKDAGESALASVIELSGALCALLVAIPLMRAVLELLMELL